MRTTWRVVMYSLFLTSPVLAFAQQNDGAVSRDQVRGELIALEHAGYIPAYPASLQAAQERLARNPVSARTEGGYGPSASGSSQTGGTELLSTAQAIYFGL